LTTHQKYHEQGLAFAALAANSFRRLGLEFPQFLRYTQLQQALQWHDPLQHIPLKHALLPARPTAAHRCSSPRCSIRSSWQMLGLAAEEATEKLAIAATGHLMWTGLLHRGAKIASECLCTCSRQRC
jgi:hypothetical protein